MGFNNEKIFSPAGIFIIYFIGACFCIIGFRYILPGEMAPLPVFSQNWRLIRGLFSILELFPALALSALVVPFGIIPDENSRANFTVPLFQRLMTPLMTALCAAVLYVPLFFIALPLMKNYENNMRYQGEIYYLAKERAQAHAEAGEWLEATQFIGICDSIWYNSPELSGLRAESEPHMDELIFQTRAGTAGLPSGTGNPAGASVSALPGQQEPIDAADAIALGEAALGEERPLDAHWFATLGGRIARQGSPEQRTAAQLAARAWNSIETQRTTNAQSQAYELYRLKLSGYEAMVSGDWIRAYYIFKELIVKTPDDPDAAHFLAQCEKGTTEIAFFIDEMEVSLGGNTRTGTVFSLPVEQNRGRAVLRVSSLSSFPDYAYGIGIEYMAFDSDASPLFRLYAPYAKFLPITVDNQSQVLILMRALDRHDPASRWEPEWSVYTENDPYQETEPRQLDAQIMLNVSYETFLILSEMRQGLPGLHINDLFAASAIASETGYIPEVFDSEILNRLGACLFFLPMAVCSISMGWRFRAKKRPHYLFVLLLPVLPLVFNSIVYLYRYVLNTAGISLVIALGFSTALPVFIVILALCFIFSLILLAAQRD